MPNMVIPHGLFAVDAHTILVGTGVLLALLLGLLVAFIWLGRWLIRHRDGLEGWWAGVGAHPRVATLGRRRSWRSCRRASPRVPPSGSISP
jgi:hypothetical protein